MEPAIQRLYLQGHSISFIVWPLIKSVGTRGPRGGNFLFRTEHIHLGMCGFFTFSSCAVITSIPALRITRAHLCSLTKLWLESVFASLLFAVIPTGGWMPRKPRLSQPLRLRLRANRGKRHPDHKLAAVLVAFCVSVLKLSQAAEIVARSVTHTVEVTEKIQICCSEYCD